MDDCPDALAGHPVAVFVREEVCLGSGVAAGFAQPVDVGDQHFGEVGADLHDPDAGLGLGVGDVQAGVVEVV